MDLAHGGELFTLLQREGKFQFTNARFYAAQVSSQLLPTHADDCDRPKSMRDADIDGGSDRAGARVSALALDRAPRHQARSETASPNLAPISKL
eukprot:2473329-Rhodomonas_salina.1